MAIEEMGVAEAKRRFSELAKRVSRGESFVNLNRGHPMVALVPPQRAHHSEHKPIGFAAVARALAAWAMIEEDMADVHRGSEAGNRPTGSAIAVTGYCLDTDVISAVLKPVPPLRSDGCR